MPRVSRTAPGENQAGSGLVPLITVALVALFLVLPRIDPLRENYAACRDWYEGFIPAFVPGGRGKRTTTMRRSRAGQQQAAALRNDEIITNHYPG